MESSHIESSKASSRESGKIVAAKLLNTVDSPSSETIVATPPKETKNTPSFVAAEPQTFSEKAKSVTKSLFSSLETSKEAESPTAIEKVEEPKLEEPKLEPKIETKVYAQDIENEPEEAPFEQEKYKRLKKAFKETKTNYKALEALKTELETKVKAYSTGEVVPEEVTRLRNRIAELEPLEEVLNVKQSPAYHAKVSALNDQLSKLNEVAKDYGLPETVMEEASKITNRRDLNAFLLNHFDEVGALEVKGLIGEAQKIRSDIENVEKRPKEASDLLNREYQKLSALKEEERRSNVLNSAKSGWTKAILGIRQEGRIQELIPRQDDPEFNKTWVEPIQNEASTQYGRLMTALVEAGISKLDPEIAEGLGKMTALATVASTAIARANAAEKKLTELEENTKRTSNLLRPSPGSVGSRSQRPADARPSSPRGAAQELLRKVGVNI